MRYKLLIFDLDNTIFDYNQAENFALEETLEHFNCPVTDELKTSYREINEQIWQRLEKGEITSLQLRTMRFERFGKVHGFEWEADEVSSLYLKNLGRGGFLIEGAETLLFELQNDFKLASVTNGISDVQRSRLANSPFNNFFEPLIISDEVGVAKPAPGIFEILLKEAGVSDRTEVLMIGDSLTSDIAGAEAAGIASCWFNPDSLPAVEEIVPDFTIKKLSEIKNIVYVEV